MKIEIISGSARKNSLSARVALHLKDWLLKEGIDAGLINMNTHALPPVQTVFNEPADAPADLSAIVTRVFEADAFILVSPEYNGGYSPAMKNFLDHFPKQHRKAFGIVTASPGALGGIRAALQLQQLVFALSGIASPRMLVIPEVDKKFNEDGLLTDTRFKDAVGSFVNEFLWLARAISHQQKFATA
jgi:NAD(P)H-dependent FMN reductase